MPTKTIYVSQNGNSGTLKLRDSEGHNPGNDDLTTDVDSGDTIIWEKDPNASVPNTIYSIESITYSPPQAGPPPKYQNSVAILYQNIDGVDVINGNAKVENSIGTGYVTSGISTNTTENYSIGFKRVENGDTEYDDPRLKMT